MKKLTWFLMSLIATTANTGFAHQQSEPISIEAKSATQYIGKFVRACGQVAQAKHVKQQTYINLGYAYPNQHLAIIVWDNDLNAITQKVGALHRLAQQKICITGVVNDYKGKPQIEWKDANQATLG